MEAIRAAGLTLGVDPLGGAAAPLLGADQRASTGSTHRRQSGDRSDVLVHDGGPRRQDPHGLLEPVRDGAAGRAEGPVSGRVRQRPRRRPPRHRHAVGGPDESRTTTWRSRSVPADAPAAMAGATPRSARRWSAAASSTAWSTSLGRRLYEVPVGFKWFAPGLFDGSCCFGGEESAGASFLRRDGSVWTTDKDGLIMDLLAAEITARTGKDPGEHYRELDGGVRRVRTTRASTRRPRRRRRRAGRSCRRRRSRASTLAGEPITAKLTQRPGQRRADRRPEGGDAERLVRGPAVRHREHLQDLRGELPRRAHLDALVSEAQQLVDADRGARMQRHRRTSCRY